MKYLVDKYMERKDWTENRAVNPFGILRTTSKSNPPADMDPLRRFGPPYQTFLLSIVCILFGN